MARIRTSSRTRHCLRYVTLCYTARGRVWCRLLYVRRPRNYGSLCAAGLVAALCAPAHATVQISSVESSVASPQPIGTSVTYTVTATDTNPGPLTFQFNMAAPGQPLALVKDFNVGTFSSGAWTSQPFVWTPTGVEGVYQIQVVIKDFASGETASQTVQFQVNALVTGSTPVVVPTANPLVALFSAPSCAGEVPCGWSFGGYRKPRRRRPPTG